MWRIAGWRSWRPTGATTRPGRSTGGCGGAALRAGARGAVRRRPCLAGRYRELDPPSGRAGDGPRAVARREAGSRVATIRESPPSPSEGERARGGEGVGAITALAASPAGLTRGGGKGEGLPLPHRDAVGVAHAFGEAAFAPALAAVLGAAHLAGARHGVDLVRVARVQGP